MEERGATEEEWHGPKDERQRIEKRADCVEEESDEERDEMQQEEELQEGEGEEDRQERGQADGRGREEYETGKESEGKEGREEAGAKEDKVKRLRLREEREEERRAQEVRVEMGREVKAQRGREKKKSRERREKGAREKREEECKWNAFDRKEKQEMRTQRVEAMMCRTDIGEEHGGSALATSSMRSARGRRRVWRAARRPAEQARDGDGVEETQAAEEAEEENWRKKRARQSKHGSDNTLRTVLHLTANAMATATATTTAAAAAAAARTGIRQ